MSLFENLLSSLNEDVNNDNLIDEDIDNLLMETGGNFVPSATPQEALRISKKTNDIIFDDSEDIDDSLNESFSSNPFLIEDLDNEDEYEDEDTLDEARLFRPVNAINKSHNPFLVEDLDTDDFDEDEDDDEDDDVNIFNSLEEAVACSLIRLEDTADGTSTVAKTDMKKYLNKESSKRKIAKAKKAIEKKKGTCFSSVTPELSDALNKKFKSLSRGMTVNYKLETYKYDGIILCIGTIGNRLMRNIFIPFSKNNKKKVYYKSISIFGQKVYNNYE